MVFKQNFLKGGYHHHDDIPTYLALVTCMLHCQERHRVTDMRAIQGATNIIIFIISQHHAFLHRLPDWREAY